VPRPPLRALLAAALLLACSGTAALAAKKPLFQTGPYLGNVTAQAAPQVEFVATKKRVRNVDFGSIHVTCSDGRPGTVNLPGTPAKRSYKVSRGKFEYAVKAGADPAHAGTKLTGKLRGSKATGTVRVVLRRAAAAGEDAVVCDTGRRKWRARPEELLVELP
jgi:hypothetical protein